MTLEARRLKFCVSRPIKNGIGAPAEHDDPEWPRYVRITDIQNARTLRDDTFRSLPPEMAAEALFDIGDILGAAVGATFGKTYLHTVDTGPMAFAGYLVRISPSNDFDARYVAYWTESHNYWSQVNSNVIQATIQNFSAAKFAELKIPAPTRDAQILISNFLDRETARIDGLIAEKERMLALLEEKRAALISRVVTRGLDPNAPLKPSGQAWLGEIPAHWGLRRIKFVTAWLDQGSSPIASNTPAGTDELGVLKLSAVSKGRFKREENKALRGAGEEEQLLALRKGDVLITRGNTPELVADVACVPEDEPNLLLPDLIYRLRVQEEKILPEYLTSFLTTAAARVQIRRDARGSSGSMVKVSQGHVLDWLTPLPPLSEQTEIVNCLQRAEERFQSMTREVSSSLALLSERRAALITAAVTGQIPLEEMTG